MFENGEKCLVCGISSDITPLFEAISDEEIILVCQDCSIKENLPLLKKPTDEQIKESRTPYSRREVFARISGFKRGQDVIGSVSPEKEQEKDKLKAPEKVTLNYLQERMIRQREALRGIEQSPINLIENFHWNVMRARRLAKLTTKELAERMKEDENSIKMLEEGKIPRGVEPLIKKLEQFFNIQLVKAQIKPMFSLKQVEIPPAIKREIRQAEITNKPQQQQNKLQQSSQSPLPLQTLRELRERPKFSQDKLKNITIDDLVKMKSQKLKISDDYQKSNGFLKKEKENKKI